MSEDKSLDILHQMVQNAEAEPSVVRTTIDRPVGLVRKRRGLSSTKLGVDVSRLQAAGWYCHWINDVGGRIQDVLDIGYVFVHQYEIGATPTLGAPTADGSERVCRRVGVKEDGTEMRAYLMKTSLEFHEENMAETQIQPDRVDAIIRSGVIRRPGGGEPTALPEEDPESRSHYYRRETSYKPVTRYR